MRAGAFLARFAFGKQFSKQTLDSARTPRRAARNALLNRKRAGPRRGD